MEKTSPWWREINSLAQNPRPLMCGSHCPAGTGPLRVAREDAIAIGVERDQNSVSVRSVVRSMWMRAPFFFGSAVAASIRAARSLGRERAFLAIGLRSGCWREPAPPPLPARSTRIWRYRTDRPGLAPAAEGRGTFVQEDVIDYPLARRTPFSEIVRRQARPLPASCFAASASRRTRSSLSAWTWYPVTPIGLIGTI